ncbi:MAG: hypothetical protein AAB692_01525 [Patescibacteria group bacterium]|mgnify:CR=1 FL=1
MSRKVSSSRRLIVKSSAKNRSTGSGRKSVRFNSGIGGQRAGSGKPTKRSGRTPAAVCPSCFAVFYDEHWHTPFQAANMSRDAGVLRSETCDACKMADSKAGAEVTGFGGEVVLSGWRDLNDKMELLHLVRNVGKQARAMDTEHRIARIVDEGDVIKVYTTENQLAASIGKKLDGARKGGSLEIVWAERDRPAMVRWVGPGK